MDTAQQLRTAYETAKAGDRPRARQLVQEVLQAEPRNDAAWYLYAKIAGDRQKSIYCLKKVLEINPSHERARQDLERLSSGVANQNPPTPSEQQTPEKQPSKKLPGWVWGIGVGIVGTVVVACLGYIFFASALQPGPQSPSISNTEPPPVLSTPTNDCTCSLATGYLDETFTRIDIISAQITHIENAYADGTLWQLDYITYSSQAKNMYKEQIAGTPPSCLTAIQNKTVSLLWNWQQTMEYAANGQYDAVDAFIQGFVDDVSALESEGERLLQEELNGCYMDPNSGPNL